MAQNFYFTFGVQYDHTPHPTYPQAHPEGWVTIVADDEAHATHIMAGILRGSNAWGFSYTDETFDRSYYPRGEIARYYADGRDRLAELEAKVDALAKKDPYAHVYDDEAAARSLGRQAAYEDIVDMIRELKEV